MNEKYSNFLIVPELEIIKSYGGLPLLNTKKTNQKFSWNDIGDLVTKFGIPLIFNFQIIPKFDDLEGFYIYILKDFQTNPDLINPDYEKTYDDVIEESFQNFGRIKLDRLLKNSFSDFLKTLCLRLLNYTNPWKNEEILQDDLNKVQEFVIHLNRGGIIETNTIIEPLENIPTIKTLQNWTLFQFKDQIQINWLNYLRKVFFLSGVEITETTRIMQVDVRLIYGILNLIRKTDQDVVKNFALLRILLFLAPDSDKFTKAAFEKYYKAKGYNLYPRWEYCTRKVVDATGTAGLSFAFTYTYQKYHFNNNKLLKAIELIQNVENAFKNTLEQSKWMDLESRLGALNKLNKMIILLGYPDFVTNPDRLDKFYENVRICNWDHYGNSQRIRAFKQAYQFSQLSKLRDRKFWDKSTFIVNAYYNRINNRIIIPIAILNGIFFNGKNSLTDYSRLGSIIGHEITHGFDNNGKNYDENGLLNNWWSQSTQTNFNNKTHCFIEQYNEYYIDTIKLWLNGTQSLNENLADNGGVRQAFKAFKLLNITLEKSNVMGFNKDQLFFISFATMWCNDVNEDYLKKLWKSNYAPSKYRVIGTLSNMVEFSNSFNCPIKSPMNPLRKCLLC